MRKFNTFLSTISLIIVFIFMSCEDINNSYSNTQGLKEALKVGAQNAVKLVGKEDGFFMDQAIKILLPSEVEIIMNKINNINIPGLNTLLNPLKTQLMSKKDDVVKSINRAAEVAATEALPIFGNAITSMTIQDATGILFGADDAATTYLKDKTFTDLQESFSPVIRTSLDKKLVGNLSTNDLWFEFTTIYNNIVNVVSFFTELEPIQTDLSMYVTGKALDGLFNKVAKEEAAIRTDPVARVNDILKSVFGQLDNKTE